MASFDKTFLRHLGVMAAYPLLLIAACVVGWWQWTVHAAEQYAWAWGIGSGLAVLIVGGIVLFWLALANMASGAKSMLGDNNVGPFSTRPTRRQFRDLKDGF